MPPSASRKLTTILAADVVGFSRLVAADEEGTLARLAERRTLADDLFARYRGRVFNTAGDAVRAEFQSALDAVRCAVALQRAFAARAAQEPEASRLRFRVGVAIGDVIDSGGDLLGAGVTLAERLENIAPPGGICVSRAVHEAVAGKVELPFDEISPPASEGMPQSAYAIAAAQLGEPGPAPAGQPVPAGTDDGGEAVQGRPWQSQGDGSMSAGWKRVAVLGALAFFGTMAAVRFLQQREPAVTVPVPVPSVSSVSPAPKPAEPTATKPAKPAEPVTAVKPAEPVAPAKPGEPPQSGKPAEPAAPGKAVETPAAKPAAAPPAAAPGTPGAPQTATRPDVKTDAKAEVKPEPRPAATDASNRLRNDAAAVALGRNWKDCTELQAWEQAITACRAVLDAPGTLSSADLAKLNYHLGYAQLQRGEFITAIETLSTSIKSAPLADAHNARGIARHQKGELPAAIEDFSDAVKLDPKHAEALNNRAWARYKSNLLREALVDADGAVKLAADKAYIWDTKGHINEALGNKQAAISDYRKAIELDGWMQDSRDGLARLGVKN